MTTNEKQLLPDSREAEYGGKKWNTPSLAVYGKVRDVDLPNRVDIRAVSE